jgi:RNA polymerase sigma-70 factor (ECF subfamily)
MQTKNRSLTQWVDVFTEDLFSWAYKKVSDVELAKDLVQDTFLVASEKIDTFKGESSPKTWLFAILNHKIIDFYRKKGNKPVSLDNLSFTKFFTADGSWQTNKQPVNWDQEDGNLLDNTDFLKILMRCLEVLPDKWNSSIKLKYLMNKNTKYICQELNITSSNYWQIMHRAKLQLRDCINTNWFNAS